MSTCLRFSSFIISFNLFDVFVIFKITPPSL
nr:MAG TPA: hypothetical protein [Caudoviricetes sp.]